MSIVNQELKKSGLKAGVWNFSTTIINQLRNFIVSLVLARLLDPSDFGLIAMATASVGILESFVDIGFGESIIRQKTISQLQLSTVFFINLILGISISIAVFCLAPIIANFLGTPEVSDILKVISLSFIVKGFQGLPSAILKRNLNFKAIFKINFISGILSGIIGIIMALCGFGVWSLVWSQIINWIIGTIFLWIFVKWMPSLQFGLNSIKELWNFGSKLLLSSTIDGLFFNINPIIIGKFFNPIELGLYNRAQSLNILVGRYSYSAFASVLLPTLSKCQDDMSVFKSNLIKIINVVCFTTFLLSGIMICTSESLITFLYGEKWKGAIEFFKIVGFFTITGSLSNVMYYALLSIGRSDLTLRIQMIEKLLLVAAILVGINFGIYTYVFGLCFTYFIGTFIYAHFLRCTGVSLLEFILTLLSYATPFLLIVELILLLNLDSCTNTTILNIIIASLLFSVPYLLYNFCLKTVGYNSSVGLLKTFKSLKK